MLIENTEYYFNITIHFDEYNMQIFAGVDTTRDHFNLS